MFDYQFRTDTLPMEIETWATQRSHVYSTSVRLHNRTQRWICTPSHSWHFVQIKSAAVVDYFRTKLHNSRRSYKPHTLCRLFNLKHRSADETSGRCYSFCILKSVWNIQMWKICYGRIKYGRPLVLECALKWQSANLKTKIPYIFI